MPDMIIRPFIQSDIEQLKTIWEKHYQREFKFEEFSRNFLQLFSVTDDDKLISAGGLRPLLEIIICTDKDASSNQRAQALLKILAVSEFQSKQANQDSIHAFIQDEPWLNIMTNHGFKPTKGKSIYYPIE